MNPKPHALLRFGLLPTTEIFPTLFARWTFLIFPPDNADRSIKLIRVCQPGPVFRNASTTSASILSLIASFGRSMRGRPPLFLNCDRMLSGRTSLAGHARSNISFVHSGLSSCKAGSNFGLEVMAFNLLSVRPAKADGAHLVASKRENEAVRRAVNIAERKVADFAVIQAIVGDDHSSFHVHVLCPRQRNAMLGNIDGVFFRVKDNAHGGICTPKNIPCQGYWGYKNQFGSQSLALEDPTSESTLAMPVALRRRATKFSGTMASHGTALPRHNLVLARLAADLDASRSR